MLPKLIIMLTLCALPFIAQTPQAPKRPQTTASPVAVSRGSSNIDNRHWTILTINSNSSYANLVGIPMRPQLAVECVQTGEQHSYSVLLRSGPLDGADYSEETNEWLVGLRVKLDNRDARWSGWLQLNDHKTYRYSAVYAAIYFGDSSDEGDQIYTLKFLTDLSSTRTAFIEFQPFMQTSNIEARFDLRGLGAALLRYSECGNVRSALDDEMRAEASESKAKETAPGSTSGPAAGGSAEGIVVSVPADGAENDGDLIFQWLNIFVGCPGSENKASEVEGLLLNRTGLTLPERSFLLTAHGFNGLPKDVEIRLTLTKILPGTNPFYVLVGPSCDSGTVTVAHGGSVEASLVSAFK